MGKERIHDLTEVDRSVMEAARILSRKIHEVVSNGGDKKDFMQNLPASVAERVRKLMETPPVLFEGNPVAESQISLDENIRNMLPEEFFTDPTGWIESKEDIPRRYTVGKNPVGNMKRMEELWERACDTSRTKKISLNDGEEEVHIFSKRLKPEEVDEVEVLREASNSGIPVPKVIGTVLDKGNTYCWLEYINGFTLEEIGKDKLFDVPVTATSEVQFNNHIKEVESVKKQQGLNDQLMLLWRTHIPDIAANNLANSLQFFINQCRNGMPHANIAYNVGIGFLGFLEDDIKGVKYDLKDVLQQCGYESLEEFFQIFDRCLRERDGKTMEERLPNFEKIIKELGRLAVEALRIYVRKWNNIVSNHLFGCDSDDIEEEKKRLQAICEEHGFNHENSNDNFIISLPDKGKARLYVINLKSPQRAGVDH